MADPARLKTIKIKTGVVNRLAKEKASYIKECDKQRGKIEAMKEEEKDEYDIKKQTEVLGESEMMIPDCTRRLKAAYEELDRLLESENDLKENEEYTLAQTALANAEPALI